MSTENTDQEAKHCRDCYLSWYQIWPTHFQRIIKYTKMKMKFNKSPCDHLYLDHLLLCDKSTKSQQFTTLVILWSFCGSGFQESLAGRFLVSRSCSQVVRPSLCGASLVWVPDSTEASKQSDCYGMAEGISCKHSVSKVEVASALLSWPWLSHCLVLLVRGESQTHQDLRRDCIIW